MRKWRTSFFVVLFIYPLVYGKQHCFFTPPNNWMPAEKDSHSSTIKVSFLDPKQLGFRASLNLAEESINCDLEEYLRAVKSIHTSDHRNCWSNLGHFPTKAGPAILTQIDTEASSWGPIRILQLILVRDSTAYVLTGAASKRQFSQHLPHFKAAFKSLSITDNLVSAIENEETRKKIKNLQTAYFNHETTNWKTLQKEILQYKDLGAYWQALVIQETLEGS